jgi:hypothetical protein
MTLDQASFEGSLNGLRRLTHGIECQVRGLTPQVSALPEGTQLQEVNANLMLAVRHLEDARMRLGKAIQWGCQGGVSKYDGSKG